MQIPSNMLITKVRAGMYMSAWMLVWAVVSGKILLFSCPLCHGGKTDKAFSTACTALVQNYAGLVICRFFLGVTEAPFYPGATYSKLAPSSNCVSMLQ